MQDEGFYNLMNINCLNGKVRGIRPEKILEMEESISSWGICISKH